MSEYQYYEFQSVDRPLTEREMGELRRYSEHATITSTRFVNHYEWGGLKGDASAWMQKYFDAFLYVANWGTHELMFRFPRRVLDLPTARRYCCCGSASAKSKGDFVILDFLSDDEEGDGWDDDGSGWLSALIPLRAEIAAGDHRALYVAWLACVQVQALENRKLGPARSTGCRKADGGTESIGRLFANRRRPDWKRSSRPGGPRPTIRPGSFWRIYVMLVSDKTGLVRLTHRSNVSVSSTPRRKACVLVSAEPVFRNISFAPWVAETRRATCFCARSRRSGHLHRPPTDLATTASPQPYKTDRAVM